MKSNKSKSFLNITNLEIKIREVFLPFLMVSIGTILGWILFIWIFDIKLNLLPLNEELLHIFIPIVLPWIPVLIWLRRRIRILDVRGKRDNGHSLYQFLIVAAIVVPLMISLNYLRKTAYDLKEVPSISEIKNLKNEKYIKIQYFNIDQSESVRYVTSRTSGKYNEDLDFYLYISCPFKAVDNVWYGVKYTDKISNRGNGANKNRAYKRFQRFSLKQFASYDFKDVNYFEVLNYSKDRSGFIEAIKMNNPSLNEKEQVILIPKKNDFEERLSISIPWIFGAFFICIFVIFLMIIFPKIDKGELARYQKKKPLRDDDLKDMLQFLNPVGEHKAIAILILINVIVFTLMILSGIDLMSPAPQKLLEIGGSRSTEIQNGEYWRLLTSVFIHSGLAHLFSNMVSLAVGCVFIEKIVGSLKLIIVYLICGILSAVISVYWSENVIGVGASGAIFGMFGLSLSFVIFKVFPKHARGFILGLLGIFGGISLLLGLASSGISNVAHFSGFFIGFFIGIVMIILNKKELQRRANHFI